MSKSIVKGIGIGFLSCIGIGIAKTISQVLVLVLLRGHPKYLLVLVLILLKSSSIIGQNTPHKAL